jgi:hypothetical protein
MDPYRNFNTYKIDPLTEIRNAGIVTNGSVFYVSSTSDSGHSSRTLNLGNGAVKTTLQGAIDAAVNDRNDYILVVPTDGGTVRDYGTAVDINKSRVHVLGMGNTPSPMGYDGLTIKGFVSASGVDSELVSITGAGVELGGLKFLGTSGTAAGGTITAYMRIGTASTGTPHDLWVHDVQVENTQAAAAGGTAPVVVISGDVAGGIKGITFDRSWIGNWNWAPTPLISMAGTAGPTRIQFRDCTFVIDAQATTDSFITMGTGVTEYSMFKNCDFINVEAGTAPASALTGALLVDNPVLMRYCTYVNVTQGGTDTEAYKAPVASGTSTAIRDYGIAVGTAALTPV